MDSRPLVPQHGFLYNVGSNTYTTLDKAGATQTHINGIDNNNIVGSYEDSSRHWYGFMASIAAVPEPSTWALLGMGFVTLLGLFRCRRQA